MPPFLDASELRAATFIRHIELHDTLGSTNTRAAELARDLHVELPALVAARLQTNGKGRGGHKWWSTEGALTFSILVDPATFGIRVQSWPQLSLATAVAICDALTNELRYERAEASPPPSANRTNVSPIGVPTEHHSSPPLGLENEPARLPRPLIKWPNDVYVEGCKIAGILIESPGGAAQAKDRLIIGIGININNSWHSAPRDIDAIGTSLCDVTGQPHNMQQVLGQILQSLQRRYQQLAQNGTQLSDDWQNLSLLTGKDIEVQSGDSRISGTCVGIDRTAALLIQDASGTHRTHTGSVQLL